jgi:cytochrome c
MQPFSHPFLLVNARVHDALAIPEGGLLIHGLSIAAFLFHVLFMNLLLGGTPIMVVTHWLGVRTGDAFYRHLARTLALLILPALMLALVLGFTSWLFVQEMYGPFLRTATSLIGKGWIAAIGALVAGSYGLYVFSDRTSRLRTHPALHLAIGMISTLMFFFVALVFVTANVLMLHPERWPEVEAEGFFMAVRLPSVLPRYLHMLCAAIAGAGILLVLYGILLQSTRARHLDPGSQEPQEYPIGLVRYGCGWAMAGTLPQTVVGPWLLMSLPASVRTVLMDGANGPSLVFFTALTCALLAIVLLNASIFVPHVRGLALAGVVSLIVTVVLMAVVRDRVRHLWLSPHVEPSPASPTLPWEFAGLLLLAAGALILYVIRVCLRGRPANT